MVLLYPLHLFSVTLHCALLACSRAYQSFRTKLRTFRTQSILTHCSVVFLREVRSQNQGHSYIHDFFCVQRFRTSNRHDCLFTRVFSGKTRENNRYETKSLWVRNDSIPFEI